MKILILCIILLTISNLIQAIQISKLENKVKYLLFEQAYRDFFEGLITKKKSKEKEKVKDNG